MADPKQKPQRHGNDPMPGGGQPGNNEPRERQNPRQREPERRPSEPDEQRYAPREDEERTP